MAVRSASMEHYRSVFATTAVIVLGLVATSPLLQRQDSAGSQPKTNLIMASGVENADSKGWSDPPRRVDPAATATATATSLEGQDDGLGSPRPASFTLLPPETAALLTASSAFASSEPAQRVQAVRRHRAAKVASRNRLDVTARVPTAEVPAQNQPSAPQPQRAAGIDPIGDLLRGLGIGRDS
ncbi:hypothetical protein ACIQ2M_00470 [Methylobacterium sp. NPDC097299]|uniref:hypothetical protein n=2 Tax=unclassified Methylobacterium TaxID=2615210 RepID=UPI0036F72250